MCYLTVLAEHGDFHGVAGALRLAQPFLSRWIQRLESRMALRLLDRTKQVTRLTDAGEVFLPEARALPHSARHTVATTRAAVGPCVCTIGYAGAAP